MLEQDARTGPAWPVQEGGAVRARDVMTAHPSVITPDESIGKAAQMMRDRNVDVLPVINNLSERCLKGILTDRDIVVRCLAAGHSPESPVRDFMTTRHLTTVRMEDDVSLVAAKMKLDRVRRVPVLSDGGRVAGVLALSDLASRLRPADPAMVAEIERLAARTASLLPLSH
jgi:CBS domain-containing protein